MKLTPIYLLLAVTAACGEPAAIVDLRKPSLADAITVAGFSATPVPGLEQFVHRYEDTHIKLIFPGDKSLSLFSKTGHLRSDGGGTLETLEVFVRWRETGFTDADAYHFAQELEELMGMPHNKLEKWNALTPEGKQHAELLVNSSHDHKPPRFSYSMHRTFQQTAPWYFIIYINETKAPKPLEPTGVPPAPQR